MTNHGTRSTYVYSTLLDRIVEGELPPGTRMVEATIARELRVSRTPVRDALMQLAADGMLETLRGSLRIELVVSPLTAEDLQELWALVGGVEAAAVARLDLVSPAERRRLAATLGGINAELARLVAGRRFEAGAYRELQRRFHGTMVDACGGPRIRGQHAALVPHVARYEVARARDPFRPSLGSVDEHQVIITAIERGDAASAVQAVFRHWQAAADRSAAVLLPASSAAPRRASAR